MKNDSQSKIEKQVIRVLKLLSKKPNAGFKYEETKEGFRIFLAQRQYNFCSQTWHIIQDKKLITLANNYMQITQTGSWYLKRSLNPDLNFADMHSDMKAVATTINNQQHITLENINESPLSRLFKRKTKQGSAYLTREEFEAGERLRRDFERGQLQPKISASLCGAIGRSSNAQFGGAHEISNFAIDSRKRVNDAIEKLGPELSGIVLDICCFLKGLEIVERERQWPPRSAKLMLKTALSVLARYYGIAGYENMKQGNTKFWGSADYRPSIQP